MQQVSVRNPEMEAERWFVEVASSIKEVHEEVSPIEEQSSKSKKWLLGKMLQSLKRMEAL